MKQYDTTFIIDGTLDLQQREKLIARFENTVQKQGGTVNRVVRWGMRELAYEINKQKHGYYVIVYYSAPPSAVGPFENQLRLNERVLRYMTLAYDGKHPDYIKDEAKQVEVVADEEEPAEISGIEAGEVPVPAEENGEIGVELEEVTDMEENSETVENTVNDISEIDENGIDSGDSEDKENDRAED